MTQVWQADRRNRAAYGGFVAMVGGPEERCLHEHAHPDLQIAVHFGRSPSIRLTEPGQPHTGGWSSGERVAVILLAPALIAETADDVIVRGPVGFRSGEYSSDRLIRELARAIATELSAPTLGANRRLYVEAIGYTLAGHVVRSYANAPVRHETRDALTGRQVEQLSDFVDRALDQPLGVHELASTVGLAPRRFADAFRRATGQTPYQYVVRRRIDHAKRLLGRDSFRSWRSHFASALRTRATLRPSLLAWSGQRRRAGALALDVAFRVAASATASDCACAATRVPREVCAYSLRCARHAFAGQWMAH